MRIFQIKFLFTIGLNASKHKKFTHKQKKNALHALFTRIYVFLVFFQFENEGKTFHHGFVILFVLSLYGASWMLWVHFWKRIWMKHFSAFDEVESSFSIPFKACTSLHIASDCISCSRHRDASQNFGWRRVICRRTVWNESETSDLLLGSPPRHSAVWFHLKCIYDVVFGLLCCFSVRLFAWLKTGWMNLFRSLRPCLLHGRAAIGFLDRFVEFEKYEI